MARNDRMEKQDQEVELIDRLVGINRVAKVVKGGRRFAFAALVVVGDGKGKVGMGTGKAREVPEAISKATEQAKRNMIRVHLREGRTLHHDVIGRFGAGRVQLRSAQPGTGIIAGGPLRAVFEALGIQDVVAKSLGSANPYNMVKAALVALSSTESPRMVAARRNRKVSDILGRNSKGADESETSKAEKPTKKAEEAQAPAKQETADQKTPAKKTTAKAKKES